MSFKDDEKFISILGWLLEKRKKVAESNGFMSVYLIAKKKEEEKYFNKLLKYLDDNYEKKKKPLWRRIF